MLNDALMWNYWSVWKPAVRIVWDSDAEDDVVLVEPEDAISERGAFATVLRKARAGAAPGWWTITDRAGHG